MGKLVKGYKKFAYGSTMFGMNGGTGYEGAAAGLSAVSGIVDASQENNVDPNGLHRPSVGGSTLKGAASGAALGTSIVPGWGTVIGGVVGAGVGFFSGKSADKKYGRLAGQYQLRNNQMFDAQSRTRLAMDPSLTAGNQGGSYYANGGQIHIKASHKGKFTAYKAHTGKTTEEALHSDDPHVRKMAQFAKNASKWHHKANGGPVGSDQLNPQGGTATNLSSTAAEFKGPSHAQGGIDLPQQQAQVEGNETIDSGYVFSDRLGFAKLHKGIARSIGKIEEKTTAPERLNSLKLLRLKENQLKQSQEQVKAMLGLNEQQ